MLTEICHDATATGLEAAPHCGRPSVNKTKKKNGRNAADLTTSLILSRLPLSNARGGLCGLVHWTTSAMGPIVFDGEHRGSTRVGQRVLEPIVFGDEGMSLWDPPCWTGRAV